MVAEAKLILVEHRDGYAIVRLNRPKVLNALSEPLMGELAQALDSLESDSGCRCAILTGNDRAFAAGADVSEMSNAEAIPLLLKDQFKAWDRVRDFRLPLIAAVSGYALGGGCELAMMCDMIVASDTAQFGQPEITLGIMPGVGGTQRLVRAVGKATAMEMILTGVPIDAATALRVGLANKVTPVERYLEEAENIAKRIASMPPVAIRLAKQAVLKSFEMGLEAGLEFERQCFYLLFATADQKEGIQAFLEKRPAHFEGS